MQTIPTFRELKPDQCDALLSHNQVGRIAFTFHDRVGIEPIGYAYEPNRIYLRTAPGTKLATIAHHPWVAFEVDVIEGPFDWRSVIVRGTMHILHPDGATADQRSYERALALLRRMVPGTLGEEDPVPFRTVIMMLSIDEMTGRAASTRG